MSQPANPSPHQPPAAGASAARLLALAETGRPDSYYRLARMVARVLTSQSLRRRRKWCALAHALAASPGVEARLIMQALRRFEPGTAANFPVKS